MEDERKFLKKPIREAFMPLSQHKDIQEMVFNGNKGPGAYTRPKPTATGPKKLTSSTTTSKQPKSLTGMYPIDNG